MQLETKFAPGDKIYWLDYQRSVAYNPCPNCSALLDCATQFVLCGPSEINQVNFYRVRDKWRIVYEFGDYMCNSVCESEAFATEAEATAELEKRNAVVLRVENRVRSFTLDDFQTGLRLIQDYDGCPKIIPYVTRIGYYVRVEYSLPSGMYYTDDYIRQITSLGWKWLATESAFEFQIRESLYP